jgi:hypothetical protein
MQQGRLGPEFSRVEDRVRSAKGKVAVIINSWEMASSSYRYKEQLLFAIFRLVSAEEVTVFVYSQAKSGSVVPGMINRAGLGRLSAIAVAIMEIPEEDEHALADHADTIRSVSRDQSPDTRDVSVQLPAKKIKDLPYADKPHERSYADLAVAA